MMMSRRKFTPVLALVSGACLVTLAAGAAQAAPSISFKLDGSAAATLREQPLTSSGYPRTIRTFAFKLSEVPTGDTTLKVTTTPQCVFGLTTDSGGPHGQSYTVDISESRGLTLRTGVGAVDDSEYEGPHNCGVTAIVKSADAAFNGLRKHTTFAITDNDPKPAGVPASTPDGPAAPSSVASQNSVAGQLTLDSVTIDNTAVSKTGFELTVGSTAVFNGTTIPNGLVTLTVHPEPMVFNTTADANGRYRIVAVGVPLGQHRVEVAAADPEANASFGPVEMSSFSVVAAEPAVLSDSDQRLAAATDTTSLSQRWLYVASALAVVAVAIGAGYCWGKRRNNQVETELAAPATPLAIEDDGLKPIVEIPISQLHEESSSDAATIKVLVDDDSKQ